MNELTVKQYLSREHNTSVQELHHYWKYNSFLYLMMATKEAEAERKKAELRKKVEYQVACEERAHRIVERLIDNPITQEQLVNALHYITQGHYSDIVEERAVSKLCGYPLCQNSIADIPKQRYMISTKTNKVYDIESRKNFCSPKCYKASKHLEGQVSSDPVWTRKNVRPTQFDLLPLDMKIGKLGDEVMVSKSADVREDLNRLEKLERYEKTLAEKIHEHNQKKQKLERAEESEGHEDNVMPVKEMNKEENESVEYTLDKALKEMDIGNTESEKGEGKHKHDDKTVVETGGSGCDGVVKEPKEGIADIRDKDDSVKDNGTKRAKQEVAKPPKKNKAGNPSKAKTDYLMQLLDKRKALLVKMADIQNDSEKTVDEAKQESESSGTKNTGVVKSGDKTEVCDGQKVENITETPKVLIKPVENKGLKSDEKTYCKSVVEKKKEKESHKNAPKVAKEKRTVSALDLICGCVSSWITTETVEYLKVSEDSGATKDKAKTEFEKQYQELVAKVDAQEKDFDTLIGEETMDSDHTDRPSAPLPHFDVLRQEIEAQQVRVSEFMKGSFTYKVTEKQMTAEETDGSLSIVLPSVDRYDQILIRQKIVLDRINKVLPDLLSPLHLLVQDVFTDLRKLICTFSLTSDNITFKPAEWTLVTLILLRMLSRRLAIIQRSFISPSAEKYFTVFLSTLGTNIDDVDKMVNHLLVQKKIEEKPEYS